jgi:universal stress protein E
MMAPQHHPLVYIDPENADATALDQAARLVQPESGEITLVSVIEEVGEFVKKLLPANFPDWDAAYNQEIAKRLDELAAPYRELGYEVLTKVLRGRPHIEIVREALRQRHDFIVKQFSPSDEAKPGALAHLDLRLLRKSPCPVWMVRSAQAVESIAAALAPAFDDAAVEEFNGKILHTGIELAGRLGAKLHVIQAWNLYGESYLMRRYPIEEYERYLKAYESTVRQDLRRFLSGFDCKVEDNYLHMLDGPATKVIPFVVEKHAISLLVIGTVGRSGISGHLMGNTAEQVLERITTGVLALKPDGFVSPITAD